MHHTRNVGGRDRLARGLLAVGLTVVALRALGSGRPATGLLAAAGALGFGFNATTGYCGVNDALGLDTTGASTGTGTGTGTGEE